MKRVARAIMIMLLILSVVASAQAADMIQQKSKTITKGDSFSDKVFSGFVYDDYVTSKTMAYTESTMIDKETGSYVPAPAGTTIICSSMPSFTVRVKTNPTACAASINGSSGVLNVTGKETGTCAIEVTLVNKYSYRFSSSEYQEKFKVADGFRPDYSGLGGTEGIATYTVVIEPPHEHDIVIIPGVEATCTKTGLTEGKKCSDCGQTLVAQEVIPMKAHKETKLAAVKATCTSTGLTEGKQCSVCGEILKAQETIAKLDHRAVAITGAKATCTKTGLTEGKKCSVCGEILVKQEVIEKEPHKTRILDDVPATCTKTGLTEGKKCRDCGEIVVEQEVIAALGHKEEIIPEVAATCTEGGLTEGKKCTVCGEITVKQEKVPAKGHTPVELVAVEPDCTNTGLTRGSVCGVCGYELEPQKAIPAKGHPQILHEEIPATCTEPGVSEWAICEVCQEILIPQEVIPATGHTVEILPAVPATEKATGLTEGEICSVCGEILKAQEETPKLKKNYKVIVTQNGEDVRNKAEISKHVLTVRARDEIEWDNVVVEIPEETMKELRKDKAEVIRILIADGSNCLLIPMDSITEDVSLLIELSTPAIVADEVTASMKLRICTAIGEELFALDPDDGINIVFSGNEETLGDICVMIPETEEEGVDPIEAITNWDEEENVCKVPFIGNGVYAFIKTAEAETEADEEEAFEEAVTELEKAIEENENSEDAPAEEKTEAIENEEKEVAEEKTEEAQDTEAVIEPSIEEPAEVDTSVADPGEPLEPAEEEA